MAVFNIVDVQDVENKSLNLFFPVGIPKGHDLVRAGFTLVPKLMSLSPNAGSPGSTLITALVPGVGKGTTGIDLVNFATGKSICWNSKPSGIVEYGKFQCWTTLEDMGVAEAPLTI
jgi:hypothetical protein